MWDIMGYPKMSNFTGKIWENMGKWWWTCGWNGVSYIFRWDCSHWELPSWLFCGTETPAQDIRRQTHDPKPALPGIRNPTLKSSSLTLQVASEMTGGLNSKNCRASTSWSSWDSPKSMLSCNYETEPAWISLGRLKKGLSEHLAWSSLAPGRKIYIGWPGTSKRPTPLRACEWGNWLWVKVSTSGTLEIHKVQSILHYVYLWHRKCMFCSFLF